MKKVLGALGVYALAWLSLILFVVGLFIAFAIGNTVYDFIVKSC